MSILSQFKQSQNADFPNVRPSLDLRFALAKKLDPRITFTRGTSGTYFGPDGIMRTAAINEPRFDHDPITGECKGLLMEELKANLLSYSEDFTDSSWPKFGGSISPNIITSPNGTTTASKFIVNTSTTTHYPQKVIGSTTVGSSYTFSVFVKAAETSIIVLVCGSGSWYRAATFNLKTGVATSNAQDVGVSAATTYTITPYPNGWYRCSVTSSTSDGSSCTNQIRVSNGTKTNGLSGDGVSGFYLWGAQLEETAFPTSYFPTDSTAGGKTRSKDNAMMTGTQFSSWYNQKEGTFFTDVKSSTSFNANNASPFGVISSGNQIVISNYHTTLSVWLFRNSVSTTVGFFNSSMPVSSNRKSAATYRTGPPDYYTAASGGGNIKDSTTNPLSTQTKTGTLRTDHSYFEISPIRQGLVSFNGTIKRITYYPIQLTTQQLVNLTS